MGDGKLFEDVGVNNTQAGPLAVLGLKCEYERPMIVLIEGVFQIMRLGLHLELHSS